MRVLVLGSTGFIGGHVVRSFHEEGHQVRVYDRRHPVGLPEGIDLHVGTLDDRAALDSAMGGTEVLVYLSWSGYPADSRGILEDTRENVLQALLVFERAEANNVERLVFASSGGTIYGVPENVPIPESHPTRPTSLYGQNKLAVEQYLAFCARRGSLNPVILRPANVYGPGQLPERGQGLISTALGRLARDQPVEIWGDGSAVRDYIHVRDVARGFVRAAETSSARGALNLGSGRGLSVRQVLEVIGRTVGRELEIQYSSDQPPGVPSNILDITRIRQTLDWQPEIGVEAGLRETWQWIQDLYASSGDDR